MVKDSELAEIENIRILFMCRMHTAHKQCEKKMAGNENDARDRVHVFWAQKKLQIYHVWYHMKCLEIVDQMPQIWKQSGKI